MQLFFTASNNFLNTQDIYNLNVLSCFQEFYIATFSIFACNFFDFCMLLFATFSIFACKIGCFKSFTVKCAHKCNLQRINATFAENKCNFLALLLQQKLALVISYFCFHAVLLNEGVRLFLAGYWTPARAILCLSYARKISEKLTLTNLRTSSYQQSTSFSAHYDQNTFRFRRRLQHWLHGSLMFLTK